MNIKMNNFQFETSTLVKVDVFFVCKKLQIILCINFHSADVVLFKDKCKILNIIII